MSFIDPLINKKLIGDSTRIKQVLMNLVGNAIKFTEKGEVVVKVSQCAKTQNSCILLFEVVDSGIGISKQAQNKLFQSFMQADGSTTRKYGGTGLGLAICKRLIELMGGTIGVKSIEGQGSTFWFQLSFDFSEASNQKETNDEILKGKKILIVDDSASARDILKNYAKYWGMEPICACGANEAMDIINAEVSVAIIDLAMPNIDGIELAQMIKAKYSDIRMLLFTAFDQRGLYEHALEAGFDYYLTKPIKQDQLKTMLCSLCSGEIIVRTTYSSTAVIQKQNIVTEELKCNGVVLLVEDNVVNQKLASILLARMGYDFQIANNGQEALERLLFSSFDAVLMDCQMPIMDGFEATKTIRELSSSYNVVPIIAMTANAIAGDKERCIASGMNDYISKPIDITELEQKLKFWINKQDAQKSISNQAVLPKNDYIDLIDVARIREIFGESMIKDILTMAKDSTHETIELLSYAVDDNNFELAYKASHDLKGEAGNIGIIGLEKTATLLEVCAKEKNKAQLEELAATAKSQWHDLQNYINGLS